MSFFWQQSFAYHNDFLDFGSYINIILNLERKNKVYEDIYLVVLIPFIRYMSECLNGYNKLDIYNKLTYLLCYYSYNVFYDIKIKELIDIINEVFKNTGTTIDATKINNQDRYVTKIIYELAENISNETITAKDWEKMIALSIAVRIKADDYMLKSSSYYDICGFFEGEVEDTMLLALSGSTSSDRLKIRDIKEGINWRASEDLKSNYKYISQKLDDLLQQANEQGDVKDRNKNTTNN